MSRYPVSYEDPSDPTDDVMGQSGIVDFAFADTVVATDLEETVPPSGIVVSDETGHAHRLIPIAFPLPPAATKLGACARLRARVCLGIKATREEFHLLWNATATDDDTAHETDLFVRAARVGRRVRMLLSFFEWDRADILRATWIGLAVLVLAATVGAVVLQVGSPPPHGFQPPASPR